jgi:hypothetical protein
MAAKKTTRRAHAKKPSVRPKGEKLFQVRMSAELHRRMMEVAVARKTTASDLVRLLVASAPLRAR